MEYVSLALSISAENLPLAGKGTQPRSYRSTSCDSPYLSPSCSPQRYGSISQVALDEQCLSTEALPTVHRTQGKTNLDSVYDQPDPKAYFEVHGGLDYIIGDSTGRINRRAIEALQTDQRTVVAELCAGYGLSSATMGTQLSARQIYNHYGMARGADAWEQDRDFFNQASNGAALRVIGIDIASHALAYGKTVGLFDDTITKNLETNQLNEDEKARLQSVQLCTATGAFSYITSNTLHQLVSSWDCSEQYPVFMFFPLVATPMEGIRAFFEGHGMQVYFEPTRDWLPQRRFKDEAEKQALEAAVVEQLGEFERPGCAREGYLHAAPFIACPAKMDLSGFVNHCLDRQCNG